MQAALSQAGKHAKPVGQMRALRQPALSAANGCIVLYVLRRASTTFAGCIPSPLQLGLGRRHAEPPLCVASLDI